ncbi:MAG: hypothetical protein WBM50_22610 [Acidimicrobiales bacterium]
MTNLTTRRISRTAIGAATGAVLAIVWIAFDTKAVLLLAALTILGALVGVALDRPQRLIDLLERLQDR